MQVQIAEQGLGRTMAVYQDGVSGVFTWPSRLGFEVRYSSE